LPVVELTTLELKRQGLRNKDIAAREGVSEKAIEARVTSINKKLTAFQEKLEK
jgi:DNA-binding NarL/FixJ family response regulator